MGVLVRKSTNVDLADSVESKPTIGMLLDIEHIYGEHQGRLSNVLLPLLIGSIPILVYVYFGLFEFFPVYFFIPLEIFFIIRVVMIIPGREKYRIEMFKRTLYNDYTATAQLANIARIHPDGCIEYVNGNICYLVTCFNSTTDDIVIRSVQLRKFLTSLIGEYLFDCYIYNINESPALKKYYSQVGSFGKNEAADNFVKMIDYDINLVKNNSMIQCTVYAIKGRRSDWKEMKKQIDSALRSRASRVYKRVECLSDVDAINEIINRDIGTNVDISKLLRDKYRTGDYASSKVLAYDLPDDKEIVQGRDRDKPIIAEAPPASFHVNFDDVVDQPRSTSSINKTTTKPKTSSTTKSKTSSTTKSKTSSMPKSKTSSATKAKTSPMTKAKTSPIATKAKVKPTTKTKIKSKG